MRKLFLIAMMSAASVLLSAQVSAGPVKRILPQGKDGDNFYYQVQCTNDTEGSVVVHDKENKICAQAFGGQPQCNSSWTVQRAAEQACK